MFRRLIALASLLFAAAAAQAAAPAPDQFVLQLSNEVIDAVKGDKAIQAGDVSRIRALVDTKVMPHVNLPRMIRKSVGPQWNGANPEQQKRLSEEFKTYLINTYSGALTQVKDQTVRVRPLRGAADADEVVVGTDIVSQGEPIKLDYRLEKASDAWKIYDFNVLGLWATDSFRSQFARDLSAGGVDALIARLSEKNKGVAAPAKN
jgi:phospholipid transport system substrate-binding protein